MIGETVSRYLILDVLGEGGMGTVYLAEDTLLKRRVAIKVLTADVRKQHYRARFRREVLSASALSHPNIATVHDCGETSEGVPFIVMEYVEGELLSDLMRRGLTISRSLEIIEGVCKALVEAHAHNIVHRDIKPTNVAINKRGEVKVLDFGLAKQVTENITDNRVTPDDMQALLATQTRENTTIGTPMYMSPEQATGAKIDTRSDLFSAGSMLYECLTGQPAFSGQTAYEVCDKVVRHNPPKPSRINPDVPRELDHIVVTALEKNPEERYQSARELLADLNSVAERVRGLAQLQVRPVDRKPRAPHSSLLSAISQQLRRPPLKIASFVLCLGIAALSVWAAWSWFRPAPVRSTQCTEAMRNGTNALRDGTYDRAMKAFEQATGLCGDYPLAHGRLAETLTELEYTDRARQELLRVRQPDPADTSREALQVRAIHFTLTGNPRAAIQVYKQIVDQLPEGPEQAAASVDLARAYERDSDVFNPPEIYEKALRIDPQQTAAAMRLGGIYGRRLGADNTKTALSYFKLAEERYQSSNDAEGLAEVSFQRGFMYTTHRQFGPAREELARARASAEAINNRYIQIKARMQLSNVECLDGKPAEAERHATEALEFARANDLEVLTANSLVSLGNVFLNRRDFKKTQHYFERALEIADYYKTRRSRARALLALASLESQHHSRPQRVREYALRALPIVKEDGYRKWEMQAQALFGHASLQWGDYAGARAAFERQLELAKEYEDNEQECLAYEGLGIALMTQENYAEALVNLDRNLQKARANNSETHIVHALANRGHLLWRMGRYDEAVPSLAEARRMIEAAEEPDVESLAQLHLSEAQMELSRRRFDLAQSAGQAALKLAGEQFKAIGVEARSTLGLAQIYSGKVDAGIKSCEEAVKTARELGLPRLISTAILSLALAKLETGDIPGAYSHALEARENFKASGQQESEWRAMLTAALATSRPNGAQTYATDAAKLLAGFQQQLGSDGYRTYINRPDVKYAREQLGREFGESL